MSSPPRSFTQTCAASLNKHTLQVVGLILAWYTLSTILSLYNKTLFGRGEGQFGFRRPLLVSATHQFIQFCMSFFVSLFWIKGRPRAGWKRVLGCCFPRGFTFQAIPSSASQVTQVSYVNSAEEGERSAKDDSKDWWAEYLLRCVPTGLATGLDIGLSNASLQFITLTFYTLVKSATPLTILFFAFVFRLEKPSVPLVLCMLLISVGVALVVVGETEFNLVGFIQVGIATICSGLRWSLTYLLLKKHPHAAVESKDVDVESDSEEQEAPLTDSIPTQMEAVPVVAQKEEGLRAHNPIATSLLLTPIMFLSILLFSFILEGKPSLSSPHHTSRAILGYICGGGVLAWTMVLAEYLAVTAAGVVTFSVAGVIKELLTIWVSHEVLGDKPLGLINALGMVISVLGVAYYNWIKISGAA
jgi:solute carrier family 35 protein C2